MVIDTHQHFWHYTPAEFGWIPDDWASIRRDYLPDELGRTLIGQGVESCIAIQARQSEDETRWLLELSDQHAFIVGVVGWVPLVAVDVAERLAKYQATPGFVGVRHVVQGQPSGFLQHQEFNRGIEALTRAGLAYDLLVTEGQLEETIAFVDRHPNQRFILDHLAKPRNDIAMLDPWRAHILRLARRENVACKLSGGITEADTDWTPDTLTPYFDTVLDAFGVNRLMFGSNWPVQEAAGGYAKWFHAVRDWSNPMSVDERECFFSGTATDFYKLEATK